MWVHGIHYEGFVNWASGTWDADKHGISHADHAYQASRRQQVRVAVRSVYVEHRYFGCLHGADHAWVRG